MSSVPNASTDPDVRSAGRPQPPADQPTAGPDPDTDNAIHRRGVLHAAAVAGIATASGLALAACGDSGSPTNAGAGATSLSSDHSTATPPAETSAGTTPATAPAAGTAPAPATSADGGSRAQPAATSAHTTSAKPTSAKPTGARPTGGGPAPTPAGTPLGSTSEVPVGGGKIFSAANVVVTQPAAGTFRAFSATCTHQGCTVGKVAGGRIICPCHGSQFSIGDGSVQAGPAPRPLPARSVAVSGSTLILRR